jgi:hypothetical protein
MPSEVVGAEEVSSVRQEIWQLLRQQIEALNSASELTDGQLMECYQRQSRVQELRERLEAKPGPKSKFDSVPNEMASDLPSTLSQGESINLLRTAA